jgi:hypothetical protein
MSLCSRERRRHTDASRCPRFTDRYTTLEGVGKSNIGKTLVEGRFGRRCQCKYLLSLWCPSSDRHSDGLQFSLPRVTVHRVICERLEAIDRLTDAIECFHEMTSKLGGEVDTSEPMTEWVSGEFMFYLFVCHIFNLFGQISPIDVSLLPMTRRRLTGPSIHRSQRHS